MKKLIVTCLVLAILADIATIIVASRIGWALGYEQALNDNGIQIVSVAE